ncbi:alpha-1,2-mannosidase [Aquipluma nitroreducens]|uniref:Alpha-1,2-mannosidase n=1 Tax=Aquipluma nitroreducens TaxID=2010828 RepID=A0A5K7S461_9BACT|nr:GH92 family glycosyl hydrolase [Aquipluma nitroreducens]BBE16333.1 alpha-1,2-mannosidase [Aquipluma nitroreducens]
MNQSAKFFSTLFYVLMNVFASSGQSKHPVDYVNPFVGAAEFGHCFPGACVPFGMIQVGPETGNGNWAYCSGYQSTDSSINGFSQTRLNGTGCPDLGDLLMLPFTGEPVRKTYKSGFRKELEKASPGYYSVQLSDFDVKAEMTATEHTAIHRYTFQGKEKPQLLVDFQSGLVGSEKHLYDHVLDAKVILENPTTVSGYTRTKVWLDRTYYYVIKFSKPYTSKVLLPKLKEQEKAPRYVFSFDLNPGETLLVKVALSSTRIDGANKNLQAEIKNWDFENIRTAAKRKWNELLSRVQIEGSTEQKNIFYTSMYHLFIQPNNIADVNQPPFYSTLSLWDTYRAAHPLYTILAPERVDGFVNSMLHQYDQQGFLPIWALWGKETYCMIANHAVPVVVDAYLKGFRGFDDEKAYQAVKTSLTKNHQNSEWEVYNKYGYYPFDLIKTESVSKTLESVFDDYCAAQFAKALNKTDDYNYFLKRSLFYKNLFDQQTKLMRGKDSKGQWRKPFNSFELSQASSSGGDYTEGNAWQYTWHIQHDVPGLIDLMGSSDYFTAKLDSLFEMSSKKEGSGFVIDVTGLIGQYAQGNEPSHHVAYLYTLAGKPWKTQKLIREICQTQYQDKINGLCGNDDCGQMSAWYIFTNLGFYPVNPCGGEFVLGAPQLPKARIKLQNSKSFTVEAVNFSKDNIYVQLVELNGVLFLKSTISYSDIIQGGTLRFIMGNKPAK